MDEHEGRRLPKRILLVDDDPDTLQSVGEALRVMAGAEVVTAANGQEALQRLSAARPEALVTDYRMPGMDGIELAKQARRSLPRLAVVVITAFSEENVRQRARQAGVCEVVPKPVEFDQLIDTVSQCCAAEAQ